MAEIPPLEIYSIVVLPPDNKGKIERLEKELNKIVLAIFDKFAYSGKLSRHFEDNFYIKYQTAQGIEEKILDLDSTNIIFVK